MVAIAGPSRRSRQSIRSRARHAEVNSPGLAPPRTPPPEPPGAARGRLRLGGVELPPDPPVPRLDDDVVAIAVLQVRVAERDLPVGRVEDVGRDRETAGP